MASYQSKFPNPGYHNWLKAGLALLITKEGIEDFVYDEIEQFQLKCLADICTTNGLSANSICCGCSTVNILICPTAGMCKTKSGTCKFHNGSLYRNCPNQICNGFRRAIVDAHRYRCPSYKNTDATKWCTSAWEVAKCYMPADGYSHARTAAETDFNGVLCVILNHKGFQSKIADDLSKRAGIFFQAREVGNKIRHSSDLELDTPTVKTYFTILEGLLSDPKYLQHYQKAQAALGRLKQLQNDTLVVRVDDLETVLKDAASVMQNNIIDEADKSKQDILAKAANALSSIQLKQDNCLDAVTDAMMSATASLQSAAEDAKKNITDLSKTEGDKLSELGNEMEAKVQKSIEQKRLSMEKSVEIFATETIKDLSKTEGDKLSELSNKLRTEVNDSIEQKRISTEKSVEKFATEIITDLSKTEKDKMSELGNKLRIEVNDSIEQKRISTEVSVEKFATQAITDLSKTEKDKVLDIGDKVRTEALDAIKEERTSAEYSVQKAAKECIDDMTELTENKIKSSIQLLKSEVSAVLMSEQHKLRDTSQHLIGELKETGDSLIKAVENINDTGENVEFEKLKKALREDLIEFYRADHSTLPLSPLFEENDAPLTEFYVTPTMYVLRSSQSTNETRPNRGGSEKTRIPVKSYHDIFYTGAHMHRNIYVTAPAGIGKTSFMKHVALTWCHSHDFQKPDEEFFQKLDVDALETFEFLFCLSLRDIGKSSCDIDSMITTHIIDLLPRGYLYSWSFLQKVLYEEKHLVLLDGLDEWAPNPDCELCAKSTLPHGRIRNKCVRLTTTRPWKFYNLKLNSVLADQQIEISGLSELSHKNDTAADMLANKVVSHLNNKFQTSKSIDDFKNLIDEKSLWKVTGVPLILLQLLCLWYDGEPLGNSQCQIYSNMVNLLFERHEQRQRKEETSVYRNNSEQKLPSCFHSNAVCTKYSTLLFKLGKLAFDRLCNISQENELVFNRTVALQVLDENDLDICLKIGILTQSKQADCKLTFRRSNVSFLHKTYQEFLAAIYVTRLEDVDEIRKAIFKSEFSVNKLLEFEMMFIFIAGLNSDIMPSLLNSLVVYISKEKGTENYRQSVDSSAFLTLNFDDILDEEHSENDLVNGQKNLLRKIQNIVVMCSIECKANKDELLPTLAQDVFFDSYNYEYNFTLKQMVLMNSDKVMSLSCDLLITNQNLWNYKILQDILKSIQSLEKFSMSHSWNTKCDNDSDIEDSESYDSGSEDIDLEKLRNICFMEMDQDEIRNVGIGEIEGDNAQNATFEDTEGMTNINVTKGEINKSKSMNVECEDLELKKTRTVNFDYVHGEDIKRGKIDCTDVGGASKCNFILASALNQLLSRSAKTIESLEINTSMFSCLHFSIPEFQELLECISNMEEIGQMNLKALHCNSEEMKNSLDFKMVKLKKLELLNISSLPCMKLMGLQECQNLQVLSVCYVAEIEFKIPINNIRILIIREISMHHHSVKRILKNISRASGLTDIELDSITCTNHDKNCRGFDIILASLTKLSKVTLKCIKITNLEMNEECITHLEIWQMCLDDTMFAKVMGTVSRLKRMRCLKLFGLQRLYSSLFQDFLYILDLSELEELESIYLIDCYDIGLEGFNKTRRLQKFHYGEVCMGTQCEYMCGMLPTAQNLKELTFSNRYDWHGANELVLEAISTLKMLQSICFMCMSIPQNTLTFISDMHVLQKISLTMVEMSASSFKGLILSIDKLPQTVKLSLLVCTINTYEEFKQVLLLIESLELFDFCRNFKKGKDEGNRTQSLSLTKRKAEPDSADEE